MKKCVISLGINCPSPKNHPLKIWQDFPRGIKRIRERLKELDFDGDFIGWDKQLPPGAPAFDRSYGGAKPFCFTEAYKKGYKLILWVDASAYFKSSPEPLFNIIEKDGYLLVEANHSVGEYCSDAALGTLKITREETFLLKSCFSAIVGLNLKKTECRDLLQDWSEKANDGITFNGAKWSGTHGYPVSVSTDPGVKGHRYDQTALSVIAYRLGLTNWLPRKKINEYVAIEREYVRKLDEDNGVFSSD